MWFDNQAEEAAEFYAGIFKNSRIAKMSSRNVGALNASWQWSQACGLLGPSARAS
ncbi:MAG TPA: VOC family protein [Nitrosospira sp.]|nr:VOC family protein [Nitrosospira sp.]